MAASVAYQIFSGLLINAFFPFLDITHPLSFYPVTISFILANSILLYFAYKKHKFRQFEFNYIPSSLNNFLLFLIPIIIVFLSTLGALILNLNGTNLITVFMLGVVGVSIFILGVLQKKVPLSFYPYSIFLLGISILLMFSMRSFHISGWDINQEYEVFQLTKTFAHWDIVNIQQDYNTCLSITILPTIYSIFIGGNDEYIFKFYFQILFALVPLIMYLMYQKLMPKRYAFLSAFFYIAQPFFIQPMPAVIRQEIAFLFFSICIYTLFSKQFSPLKKNILLYFFGIAMVFSHYSTSLVAIVLFIATILLELLVVYWERIAVFLKLTKTNTFYPAVYLYKKKLSILFPIVLLLLTFIWYGQYAEFKTQISGIVLSSINTTTRLFNSDLKSPEVSGALSIFTSTNSTVTQRDVNKYINPSLVAPANTYYSADAYSQYHPVVVQSKAIAPPIVNTPIDPEIMMFFNLISLVCKVLVLIGGVYFVSKRFPLLYYEIEYVYILIISLVSVFLLILIPPLSVAYNLTRLYMQVLIIVSPSVFYGGIFLMKFLKLQKREYIMGSILVVYFLYTSSFLSAFFGGNASMQLFNYGDDYDKFYTHSQEIASAQWLGQYRDMTLPVYADDVATLRLVSFGEMDDVQPIVIPKIIQKDSYVYSDVTNVTKLREDETVNNINPITYTYPLMFLEQNKNIIYNNGSSMIFR
ncbi:MAG TPA: DUF2206 domain-containing protein [Candidatus Saccharimonadales bacterium]|nr:DUF2206 domain-containing protein [Candidatus Saccharimonadales bacterium]